MSPQERHARIRDIFLEAKSLDSAARVAFLDQECAGDSELRREADSLLQQTTDTFLTTPVLPARIRLAAIAHAEGLPPEAPPAMTDDIEIPIGVGRYRILRKIGEGGMGIVYEAEQESPRRRVALKLVRPGMTSRQAVRRFEYEAQVLGDLQHPGIAQIYEAGVAEVTWANGRVSQQPFFAMELVCGRPIDEHIREHNLTTRARLELFALVCDAVHQAHLDNVIHRDLKPANILVVASPLDDPLAHHSISKSAPSTSVAVLRPKYAVQVKILDFGVARVTNADVDAAARTETGQLVGTLAYMSPEQVAGRPEDLDARSDVYALGVILYELLAGKLPYDVRNRSVAEAARIIRDDEPSRLSSIDSGMRGDLETIVNKALEKERTCRYPSAAALAEDVRRYLNDEPIVARPPSTWYQLQKFAKRNRVLVGVVAAAFLIVAAGMIVALWQAVVAHQRAEELRRRDYINRLALAQGELRLGSTRPVRSILEGCPEEEKRTWEWQYLNRLSDQSVKRVASAHSKRITAVACSRDGPVIASGDEVGTIKLWRPDLSEKRLEIRSAVAYIEDLAFTIDGKRLASASRDGAIVVWDSSNGEALCRLGPHDTPATAVAFCTGGNIIASASEDGAVVLWNVNNGHQIKALQGHKANVQSLAFRPDGSLLASGAGDGTIILWSPLDGCAVRDIAGPVGARYSVAFSADGKRLISEGSRGQAVAWDVEKSAPSGQWSGSDSSLCGTAFAWDDRIALCANEAGAIEVWDAGIPTSLAVFGATDGVFDMAALPDGRQFLTGGGDGDLRLWDSAVAGESVSLTGHVAAVQHVTASADGRFIASVAGQDVFVWDADTLRERWIFHADSDQQSASFSPDGRQIVASGDSSTINVLEIENGRLERSFQSGVGKVKHIAFRRDSNELVVIGNNATIESWNLVTSKLKFARGLQTATVSSATTSSDGRLLAVGDAEGNIRIADIDGITEPTLLHGHKGDVVTLSFSADGRLLISGGADETIRWWTVGEDGGIAVATGHTGPVRSVMVTPDNTRIISGGEDSTVRIWNASVGEQLLVLPTQKMRVASVTFNATKCQVIAGTNDGEVLVWEAQQPDAETLGERLRSRLARNLVDRRFGELASAKEVADSVRKDDTLPSWMRNEAVRVTEMRGDRYYQLEKLSWKVVERPGADARVCELALRRADLARQLAGESDIVVLHTFGVAQHRAAAFGLASYEEAANTLKLCAERRGLPHDFSFLAMALLKAGHMQDAAEAYERAEHELAFGEHPNYPHWHRFVREARMTMPETAVSSRPAETGDRRRPKDL